MNCQPCLLDTLEMRSGDNRVGKSIRSKVRHCNARCGADHMKTGQEETSQAQTERNDKRPK
jgi:hypothetical protein